MPLAPTTPNPPEQRIDQTYGPNGLVEEVVWTWPPNGTGTRRRDGQPDEPVTGLPIPTPDPVDPAVAAAEILAEADELSPALPADLADILSRAAAALRGEA